MFLFFTFLIQFDSFTKCNGNFSLINNMDYMSIMTLNDRKCQNALKCFLRNGTESKNTSSYILFDHLYAFGLSRNNFFCRKQRGNEGGGLF